MTLSPSNSITGKFVAACPDCGWNKQCENLVHSLRAANLHNTKCKEKAGRNFKARYVKRVK